MTDLRTYGKPKEVRVKTNTPVCDQTHTIRRGETLAGIARSYALTLDELLAANPTVNPVTYRAGTVLCIPKVVKIDCCTGRLYCVQNGDTPDGIATMFGITRDQLLTANPILSQIGLIPGQILCIPLEEEGPQICPGAAEQIVLTQGTGAMDILAAYNVSYSALQAVNPGMDLNNLSAGQTLCIPVNGARGTCVDCESTYILQAGDTLESVAESLGIDAAVLMALNPTFLPGDFAEGMMICTA